MRISACCLALLLIPAAVLAAATTPFEGEFSELEPWFEKVVPEQWAVEEEVLRNTLFTDGPAVVSSASVEFSDIGGGAEEDFILSARFSVPDFERSGTGNFVIGLGVLGEEPVFADAGSGTAPHYVAFIFFDSSTDSHRGQLRLRRVDGSSTRESSGYLYGSPRTLETGAEYGLTLGGRYTDSGELELLFRVDDGDDEITVTLEDSEPIDGRWFGLRNRINAFGGGDTHARVDYSEFRVVRETMPRPPPPPTVRGDGYRGIWFTLGQFSEYGDKYSGGLGTYTANHLPLAVYSPEVDKTFFVYGGTRAADERHLWVMASWYDHAEHRVPRPTVVYDKQGVDDPHDNPSLALDGEGYIRVFVSGRGRGRPGLIFRSREPYSTDDFDEVYTGEFTYPQPWYVPDAGFFHLFTRYTDGRELYFSRSEDGAEWEAATKLAGIGGHYQVSRYADGKIGTFFNRHPGGSVDRRTDLYYVETEDFGETWTTAGGTVVSLPLTSVDNPARVIDYAAQDKLQYTVDLEFDEAGHPVLLYVTSFGHQPGPDNDPREWVLTRWDGAQWHSHVVAPAGHNYDHGSLYLGEEEWVIVAPTGTGPQEWGTGGEMERWMSRDRGESWERTRKVTRNSVRNHKFARVPLDCRDPFFAFWADGDTGEFSESHLYFSNFAGTRVWELPYDMEGDYAQPRATFSAWRQFGFSASELAEEEVSGPAADPSGRGIPNLARFAFGLDEKQPVRSGLPGVRLARVDDSGEQPVISLSYSRLKGVEGIDFIVEVSNDLNAWVPPGGGDWTMETEDAGDAWKVTLSRDLGDGEGVLFYRVRLVADAL